MSHQNKIPRKNPNQLPEVSRGICTAKKWFLLVLFISIILTVLCGSVVALPSAQQDTGAGNFDQGIAVYWPYHVLLMSAGFILLVTGLIIARYHKTGHWYRTHLILGGIGGACIIAGIFVGIYMVALSGFPQLHNIHEILGITTGTLVIAVYSSWL